MKIIFYSILFLKIHERVFHLETNFLFKLLLSNEKKIEK